MRHFTLERVIDDGEFVIVIQPPYPAVDLDKYDVYWSVYEHLPEKDVTCVGDFTTREAAEEFIRPYEMYKAHVARTSTIDEWIDANTPYATTDHDLAEKQGLPSPDTGEEYVTMQDAEGLHRLYLMKVELVISPDEESACDQYSLTVRDTPYSYSGETFR